MIITKTPIRLSLFGGGTDYLSYLHDGNPGAVLGTTIDKYIYIACRYLPPFFEYKTQLQYSIVERVKDNADIQHRAIKGVLDYLGITDGIDLVNMADIPAKSGVGSSSAFLVGLINNLTNLKNRKLSKQELYESSVYMEQKVLKENVGLQDSAWAAYGGFNIIKFHDKKTQVFPLKLTKPLLEELQNNILLYYTGINRIASDVAGKYIHTLGSKKEQQRSIYNLVYQAGNALIDENIDRIGELLHQGWIAKKSISPFISSKEVDDIYEIALKAGALGGKLIGAGGGGCVLFYVPREKRSAVRTALSSLVEIPFRFEQNGSEIIFNSQEDKNG